MKEGIECMSVTQLEKVRGLFVFSTDACRL